MYALDRIGAKYTWTDDEKVIQAADKVIFPGVGEASTAMAYLKEKKLDQLIPTLKQPVLATCIGMHRAAYWWRAAARCECSIANSAYSCRWTAPKLSTD